MERPFEGAVNQSPEWGKHAAAILVRSTGLLIEAKIDILSLSTEGLSHTPCLTGRGSITAGRVLYIIYIHHQERTPVWGIAVRMSPLQAVRSCARCQAEKRPMLAGVRSASTVRVHVCAGLPLRLLQSRGWP